MHVIPCNPRRMARYSSGRADPEIAARLKSARRAAGVTQPEAALAVGCSVGTLIDWEAGRTEPVLSELKTLCRLYRVTPDSIVGVTQEAAAA